MAFDIYGNRLTPGHCEVHPWVHCEYPCPVCMERMQQREPEPPVPQCDICGQHEAVTGVNGYGVCSEGCAHEAASRDNSPSGQGGKE